MPRRPPASTVPAAVREAYEEAEQDEQYTALATALPKAAAAVPPVAAGRAAAAERTSTR